MLILGILIAAEDRTAVSADTIGMSASRAAGTLPRPSKLHHRWRPRLTGASPGAFFLQQDVEGDQHLLQQFGRQQGSPLLADVADLAGERVGAGQDRRPQRLGQGHFQPRQQRAARQGLFHVGHHLRIGG